MSARHTLAENAKAIIAAVGGVLSVLVAGAGLFAYAPTSIAGPGTAVLAAIEVLRTANVWFVRNQGALENVATAVGEIVEHASAPAAPNVLRVTGGSGGIGGDGGFPGGGGGGGGGYSAFGLGSAGQAV